MAGWQHLNGYLQSDEHKNQARNALMTARKKLAAARSLEKANSVVEYEKNPTVCDYCSKNILYEKRGNRFCNRSCSAKFNNSKIGGHTQQIKDKISNSLTGRANPRKGTSKIKVCVNKMCEGCQQPFITKTLNQKFCNRLCYFNSRVGKDIMSRSARLKMANQPKRSKNEILFGRLCSNHFTSVTYNEPMFNGWDADVIIDDIKVAVLWNGKWHYEQITKKHSVKQVQNRDVIKLTEIKKVGYVPYVIKDMGSYSKQKVEEEFSNFMKWISEIGITRRS